jgi:hypothetical protein
MTESMENRKAVAEQPAEVKPRRPGQPTKFRPEYVDIAYRFCLLKATDRQLAELFKVSSKTINKWKKLFPEFGEALRTGKVTADTDISKSLYHRAKGFEHRSVDVRLVNNEMVRTTKVRYFPPNVRSIMFWLRNRQPDKWREKNKTQAGLDAEAVEMILSALPPEIARAVWRKLMKTEEKPS